MKSVASSGPFPFLPFPPSTSLRWPPLQALPDPNPPPPRRRSPSKAGAGSTAEAEAEAEAEEEDEEAVEAQAYVRRLHAYLEPRMLRRLKHTTLLGQLPAKVGRRRCSAGVG